MNKMTSITLSCCDNGVGKVAKEGPEDVVVVIGGLDGLLPKLTYLLLYWLLSCTWPPVCFVIILSAAVAGQFKFKLADFQQENCEFFTSCKNPFLMQILKSKEKKSRTCPCQRIVLSKIFPV